MKQNGAEQNSSYDLKFFLKFCVIEMQQLIGEEGEEEQSN
jgi:hypothetical protein